jgi:Cdc6-like AAA superfamily ATPase
LRSRWTTCRSPDQKSQAKTNQLFSELSRAVHSDNQAIKNDTSFVRDAIQQDQTRQRHNMIMDWISSTDFQTQQDDTIARRQEGTGLWFVDSPKFINWLHESKQTLFCPGIPGAGKTMMAAITVHHLLQTVRSNTIGVSYIYCNYKAQADQNTTILLATILKQLVRNRLSIADSVTRLYDLHATRKTRPSLEEIFNALQSVLTSYSTVYVIIDALDECTDKDGTRSQLLARLRDLQRKTDLRLMTTSRLIPDIVQEFDGMSILEIRASDADVQQFVAGQIYRLPKCIQRDKKLQGSVQDKIVEAVDGMYVIRTPLTSTVSL